jgi:hypothetical protein
VVDYVLSSVKLSSVYITVAQSMKKYCLYYTKIYTKGEQYVQEQGRMYNQDFLSATKAETKSE